MIKITIPSFTTDNAENTNNGKSMRFYIESEFLKIAAEYSGRNMAFGRSQLPRLTKILKKSFDMKIITLGQHPPALLYPDTDNGGRSGGCVHVEGKD